MKKRIYLTILIILMISTSMLALLWSTKTDRDQNTSKLTYIGEFEGIKSVYLYEGNIYLHNTNKIVIISIDNFSALEEITVPESSISEVRNGRLTICEWQNHHRKKPTEPGTTVTMYEYPDGERQSVTLRQTVEVISCSDKVLLRDSYPNSLERIYTLVGDKVTELYDEPTDEITIKNNTIMLSTGSLQIKIPSQLDYERVFSISDGSSFILIDSDSGVWILTN